MAFQVYRVPDQSGYCVLLIVCALVCVGAVWLRFVATRRSNRTAAAEDWFALAAVLPFLVRIGTEFDLLINANGRTFDPAFDEDNLELERIFKTVIAANTITLLDQTFAKFSICALYRRMFGVNQVYRRWIYVLAAAQFVAYFGFVFMQLLQCRPLYKFWKWGGGCMPWTTILVSMGPPNSLVDFGLVALAMVMIRPMQLKPGIKWKLRFLFGLGMFAGVFGFIKIGISYSPDLLYVTSTVGIWAIVQSAFCIICCCAPIYRPLFPGRLWSRVALKLSACRPRPKSKHIKTSPGSQTGSWQPPPLDSYFQGEGQYYTPEGYTGSNRCLVTSDARPGASCNDKNHPVGSIQVDRRVDVDYPMYQRFGQEADGFPNKSQPSTPSAAHLQALKVPADVSYARNTGEAVEEFSTSSAST